MADLPEATLVAPFPMEPDQWHDLRLQGIGGSEAATICGLNRYSSALELWLVKTGLVLPDRTEPGPESPMWWGHALESPIAEAFQLQTGLFPLTPEGMFAHRDRPWQLANIDRLVYEPGRPGPVGVLEIKTTGIRNAPEWADGEVPAAALVQLQHYLSVTGLRRGWIAGLIGGQGFVVREVERDDGLLELLLEQEETFWGAVQQRIPPPPDGSVSASRAIRTMYPAPALEDGVALLAGELQALDRYRDARYRERIWAKRAEQYKQQLQLALGDHPLGLDPVGRTVVRWTQARSAARWDTAALERDHPELAEKYKQARPPTRRFTVMTTDDEESVDGDN